MKICVGICGSIASYRSMDFVKELVKKGHEVQVVLTRSAEHFVSRKCLETFSGNPVVSYDMFASDHFSTDHIELARWADKFVIYGLSANSMCKLAYGLADDALSLQLLAFEGPVFLVPAMNPSMWKHPTTQRNYQLCLENGYQFIDPIKQKVACGEYGVGHIANDQEIFEAILSEDPINKSFLNKKVLITAGPMQALIDPVRMIKNSSSGQMGLELARSFSQKGAEVTVLLGPVEQDMFRQFEKISKITIERYVGAGDYKEKLAQLFKLSDYFFSASAVLDFIPVFSDKKIKREASLQSKNTLSFDIQPVDDFVKFCVENKNNNQVIVAFAAEVANTDDELLALAKAKLKRKGADYILLNKVSQNSGPFSESNSMWIIKKDEEKFIDLGFKAKKDQAHEIVKFFESEIKKTVVNIKAVTLKNKS